ncbi:FxSxx-COOH system tetratricopeptide repeat protein [Lentzea californiensis]|uniref:FxSxx-COOH system tetratricopeptide repeat protein n=1 Tax=Lentzea californiensis TaxID=438851 RepID=UPI002165B3FD|nr:FxSxx-COOH system tetratricopeptide repeat protein [Lentzea californiensis]MCR3752910.1 Tetratricopeptide repeat-containing protein [Lentzea californiensis]
MKSPLNPPPVQDVVLQHFDVADGDVGRLSTSGLSYREVRDSLWLAARIHGPGPEPREVPPELGGPISTPSGSTSETPAPQEEQPRETPEAEPFDITGREPAPERFQQWTPSPETVVFTGVADATDRKGRAVSAWPTMPAMPERRAISRALRPLSRRHPSPWQQVVDEEATAIRAAQDGLWIPELTAAPSRRFDVAFVVDTAVAGGIWEHTTREFRAMLEQQGAFRDVRTYFFDTGSAELPDRPLRSEGDAAHDCGFLVDPTGRRVVLVLTDTIGRAWHSGAMSRALHLWAEHMPVAIVQTLAQRLWSWGGIVTRRMRLRSPAPGVPNKRLRVPGLTTPGVAPVPVLGLSAEWMSGWSRLIASPGAQTVETTATLVSAHPEEVPLEPDDDEVLSAEERVLRFRTHASSEGFHLAGLLAATPLSPPLMKLVQRVLLPGSDLSALAEVTLGGLMHRIPSSGTSAHAVAYEFANGVREELLSTGRRMETARVARVLDDHAGSDIAALRDLRTALDDPAHVLASDVSPENRPYLEVQAAVLRALAGPHAPRAKQLRRALDEFLISPRPTDTSADLDGPSRRTPDGDEYVITTSQPKVDTAAEPQETNTPQGVDQVSAPGTHTPDRERHTSGTQPKIWGSVPLRNPDFVGRTELLEQLQDRLNAAKTTAVLPSTLHGLGGVGKSQTVVEYIHRHATEYDLVWWVPAEQSAQITFSFVELAKRLGVATAGSADTAVPAVLETLRTYDPAKRWLLVFDNADNPREVRQFFPMGTGHIIVTSRNPEWSGVARSVHVDLFTRAESIELLHRRGGEIDEAEANALAEALGDLPLAVEQAAAWRATTGMQVPEYLELLEQNRPELLDSDEFDDTQVPVVAAVWNVPLDRLRDQHPDALQLLQVCAFFGPEPISQRLFRSVRSAPVPHDLQAALRDPIKLARAVRQISRYSLAKLDHRTNSLQLHRLVQTVLKNSLSPVEQADLRHAAHVLLSNGAPGDPDSTENWPRYAELLPHVLASQAVDCQDEWVRELIDSLVRYLLNTGDLGGARDLAEQAVGSWTETLGEAAPDILKLSLRLAVAMRRLGEIDKAISLNEQTHRLFAESVGEHHESMLEMLDVVAADRRSEGRFREELELQQTVYDRARQLLGEDDPTTLRYAHNLGGCLRLMGDFARARELDEDTLRRRTAVLGADHSQTLGSRNALCVDLRECGYYAEAAQSQDQAMYDLEKLGPDHPRVIGAKRNLSVALRKAGDHMRAQQLSEDCLDRYRSRHGDTHIDTVTALMNLSTDLRHSGDLEKADEFAQRSYRRFEELRGRRHPYTLIAALNVAVIHRLRGESEQALRIDRQAYADLLEVLDADHPSSLVAATNLASDLAALDRVEEARALSEGALERSRRVLGPEHPSTLALSLNLSIDLEALGEHTAARTLHRQTVTAFQRVLGEDHPATIAAEQYIRANCDTDTMQL